MQTITIANQKGGTAKSTTCAALAQAGAIKKKKVLCIDLDPQGNLTFILSGKASEANAFDLLNGTPAKSCIQRTESNVDLIPASWNLSTLQTEQGSARRLKEALQDIKGNYDLILIDTPPTVNVLLLNALNASDSVIIPMHADTLSIQALYLMLETVQAIKQNGNAALAIKGAIITEYAGRGNLEKAMHEAVKETLAKMGVSYLGTIRKAVAMREATTLQKSLYEYAPKSKPAEDYLAIYKRIIRE